jgi:hypothetical protein
MDDSSSKEWPAYYPPPPMDPNYPVDPAYFEKINKEIAKLAAKIQLVEAQPCDEEIWATVGDLRYGHPVTPLILRYRALIWLVKHPPDPRGEPMYCRSGPYTVYVRRADIIEVLGYGERTIDRMLAEVREALYKKPYDKITVEQFCWLHELPEDKIQQQLHELFQKRWKKIKRKDE